MSQAANLRPDAPGSPLPSTLDSMAAIQRTCQALDTMRLELDAEGADSSREHLIGLSEEIRKLAAMIRRA